MLGGIILSKNYEIPTNLLPVFSFAQIRFGQTEFPCVPCDTSYQLLFRSEGGIDLSLIIHPGFRGLKVLFEDKLYDAGFVNGEKFTVCFDNRKIIFTDILAYEGDKVYICNIIRALKL